MHTITRYEEKSDQLFICINHTEKPVYVEHFFNEDERKDDESRKATIEKLVAKLEIKADEYVEPEPFVSKVEEAREIKLSDANIASAKTAILEERMLEAVEEEPITK
jgi:hypothetical protein